MKKNKSSDLLFNAFKKLTLESDEKKSILEKVFHSSVDQAVRNEQPLRHKNSRGDESYTDDLSESRISDVRIHSYGSGSVKQSSDTRLAKKSTQKYN